jgi:hypothetical protein
MPHASRHTVRSGGFFSSLWRMRAHSAMNSEQWHPLLQVYEGEASVSVPEWNRPALRLPVSFDAKSLGFAVKFKRNHPMWGRICMSDSSDYKVVLREVCLRSVSSSLQLCGAEVQVWMSGDIDEVFLTDTETCSVQFRPYEQCIELTATKVVDEEWPSQVFYSASGANALKLADLAWHTDRAPIEFYQVGNPVIGLQLRCRDNFFEVERHLHAAWSLLQGVVENRLLEIDGCSLRFYGETKKISNFPLVRGGNSDLSDAVFQGFVSMSQRRLIRLYQPLKMYLASKEATSYVEIRFLVLMASVEAMDQSRDLEEMTTAALLGVDEETAKLCNCLRNKLIHGAGGFGEALRRVLQDDFQSGLPQHSTMLMNCLNGEDNLNFWVMMTMLWERMDAFWCAYAKVPSQLQRLRYARAPLGLPINLNNLRVASVQLKNRKREKSKRQSDRAFMQDPSPMEGRIKKLEARADEMRKRIDILSQQSAKMREQISILQAAQSQG